MVSSNFFFNSEFFRIYNKLVVIKQLRGKDLLVCCFDTGEYYDSYSLAILHSYYERKSDILTVGCCRIISLVDNDSFRTIKYKGNFKENNFSYTRGGLTKFLEENKIKTLTNYFSLTNIIQNKITFNNYKDVNLGGFFNRLDAIFIASLTNEYQTIIQKYAQYILNPNGIVFICDNSDDIELKGMQLLEKGVYVRI